ncbi:trypsin, alkaline B-like [Melitaea cinxia]|uniref:trypsin, alkaline B-like n=1 Tax=Melitaea cinxia TaxID=113334 RepID=UPI001E26F6CD|nr:trypsin, alkaline B-like [Melitaea cinxia]
MRTHVVLVFCLAVVTDSTTAQKIVGGDEVASITQYPFITALLGSPTGFYFSVQCGGTIINNRSVLTAAHCFTYYPFPFQWRIRAGSLYHNRDGFVASTNLLIIHPNYDTMTLNNDIAIIRIIGEFSFNDNVGVASMASYTPADNSPVWAVGWGSLYYNGPPVDRLRHVQKWTVNQATCRDRYEEINDVITENMLCSGYLDVGGRDACQGDSGGPLLHNNVVVGVTSFGEDCAHSYFPGVNVRISNYISWIQNNR